ncbi:Rho guanine nucleotide exchange factor 17, partial [Stegodyphus mimosarum]
MRSSLSSSPLSCLEDSPSKLLRADKSPSKSCYGGDSLTPAQDDLFPRNESALLLCGFCATWDTRTHVVGELYDTEKSYVESLQILANKYMKPLKSPEYSGIVETGLVDEIFFQIPEILNHHEGFLELLKQ